MNGEQFIDRRKPPAPFRKKYVFTKDGKLVPVLPKKQKPETRLRGWISSGASAARHQALAVIAAEDMSKWFDPTCPPAEELAGCSMEELADHLQAQFDDGMTWDSWEIYGWHIDHIRPKASFDQSIIEEVKKCWNWSNLRPVWASINLSKGSSFDGERPTYRAPYKGKTPVKYKKPTQRQIAAMVYGTILRNCEREHLRRKEAAQKS